VREQHAQSHALFAAARLHADDKARQDIAEARVEVENAASVEEHGSRGGGDNLGDAGEIEDGRGLDSRGLGFVRESAYGVEGGDPALVQDAKSSAGKGALGDGLFQDGAGGRERRNGIPGKGGVGGRFCDDNLLRWHENRVARIAVRDCIGCHENRLNSGEALSQDPVS
jgi:hypothetical protein